MNNSRNGMIRLTTQSRLLQNLNEYGIMSCMAAKEVAGAQPVRAQEQTAYSLTPRGGRVSVVQAGAAESGRYSPARQGAVVQPSREQAPYSPTPRGGRVSVVQAGATE